MNMAVSIPNNQEFGKVIPFKTAKITDKFQQGYVQSSQLYRREVYPFLSDAARAVYFELENHIHGYQKETAHVSYSQLQGSNLDKARKLSRKTISKGLSELIEEGVITLISKCQRRGNSYRINEVSLAKKQEFLTYSFISITYQKIGLVVPLVNHSSLPSEPLVVPLVNTTNKDKEIFKENKKKDWFDFKKLKKHVEQQNKLISVEQLKTASWFNYEFEKFEEYNTDKQLTDELKHSYLATWLLNAYEKHEKPVFDKPSGSTTQPNTKEKDTSEQKPRIFQKPRFILSPNQVRKYANQLSAYEPFSGKYAQVGEQPKDFKNRLLQELCNPSFVEKHIQYLKDLGYAHA